MSDERKFRLALSIKPSNMVEGTPESAGVHAALVVAHEPDRDSPLLVIEAGNLAPNDTGAAILAQLFEDAASAIREYLSAEVQEAAKHTPTEALPTSDIPVPLTPREDKPRPRFNPRPIGGER